MGKLKISEIRIGDRVRKRMLGIDQLRDSIAARGLLQPIVVDASGLLVCGHRRLEACRMLGWPEIDVVTLDIGDDLAKHLLAERDENTCRSPFTKSEMVEMARRIAVREREAAAARAKAGKPCETFSQGGKSREKIAAAVGTSHKTLSRCAIVVDSGIPELVASMDEEKIGADPAAKIAALPKNQQKAAIKEKLSGNNNQKPVAAKKPDMRLVYCETSPMSALVVGAQILLRIDEIGRDDPGAVKALNRIIARATELKDSIEKHQEKSNGNAA